MSDLQEYLDRIAAGQDTKPSDISNATSTESDSSQYLSHGQNIWNYELNDKRKGNEQK